MLTAAGAAVTMKSGVACFHTSAIAVALAALPACVRPYRSSSVRNTLKWLIVSVNWPCFTIGPTKIVGIWLLAELSSSSQVTIKRLLCVCAN